MPLSKLGILFGWFGCDYECNMTDAGAAYGGCPTVTSNFFSASGPLWSEYPQYIKNATGPVLTNSSSLTRVLNYQDGRGGRRQLWYDDPESKSSFSNCVLAVSV